MFGEIVPRGSLRMTSIPASAVWVNAAGVALNQSAPAVAATLRINSRRLMWRSLFPLVIYGVPGKIETVSLRYRLRGMYDALAMKFIREGTLGISRPI